VFIRKKSHRQTIAAGYTFSDCISHWRTDNEIHSQPAAPDNRLSSQYRRIKGYAVSPVNFMSLSAI
jgi:hypothetical protein